MLPKQNPSFVGSFSRAWVYNGKITNAFPFFCVQARVFLALTIRRTRAGLWAQLPLSCLQVQKGAIRLSADSTLCRCRSLFWGLRGKTVCGRCKKFYTAVCELRICMVVKSQTNPVYSGQRISSIWRGRFFSCASTFRAEVKKPFDTRESMGWLRLQDAQSGNVLQHPNTTFQAFDF